MGPEGGAREGWGGQGRARRAAPHRVSPLAGCRRRCCSGRRRRTPCSPSGRSVRGAPGCGRRGEAGGGRGAAAPHKGAAAVLTRSRTVGFRGPQKGGGRPLSGLIRVWPVLQKRSDVESLSEPIKAKGSSHLLAWLKGINGFYGIHRGMQIEALRRVWRQRIGIIDPFVSEGGRRGLHSYRVCNVAGTFRGRSV